MIKQKNNKTFGKDLFFIILGAMLYGAGINMFFIPNGFIDGGITGIAMIINYLTKVPIGIFLIGINIPFVVMGAKKIGHLFSVKTLIGIGVLALAVEFFRGIYVPADDYILAAVFGGVILGLGLGFIIRYGGCLDGTEIVAIIYDKKTGFSIGEIIMIINLLIMSVAGAIFGWEKAMYSFVAYFVASKVIDIAIEGFNEAKAVMIISSVPDEISKKIVIEMGKGATILQGKGGYKNEDRKVIYTIVKRLEIAQIKEIVNNIDPLAFVTISGVHEVMNGRVKKK